VPETLALAQGKLESPRDGGARLNLARSCPPKRPGLVLGGIHRSFACGDTRRLFPFASLHTIHARSGPSQFPSGVSFALFEHKIVAFPTALDLIFPLCFILNAIVLSSHSLQTPYKDSDRCYTSTKHVSGPPHVSNTKHCRLPNTSSVALSYKPHEQTPASIITIEPWNVEFNVLISSKAP
jgi:hypothetical protein